MHPKTIKSKSNIIFENGYDLFFFFKEFDLKKNNLRRPTKKNATKNNLM